MPDATILLRENLVAEVAGLRVGLSGIWPDSEGALGATLHVMADEPGQERALRVAVGARLEIAGQAFCVREIVEGTALGHLLLVPCRGTGGSILVDDPEKADPPRRA